MRTTYKNILLAGALMVSFAFGYAQSADPVRVRIGYASAIHGQAAKALDKASLASKHGLKAEFTFFQYGPPQIEGLVSKTLDASFTSLVPTASLLDKQPGALKVVAELGQSVHGLLVQGDSAFKQLLDLKGRSIGVPFGSDSHADLLVALKEAGLDPKKDVQLQNLAPNEQGAAFQQRLVDAVLVRPPLLERLQKEQKAREIKQWPHHLWVIARSEFLAANPGVEKRLQAAIRDAVLYVNDNPAEAAAWYAEDLRQKPEAVLAASKLNPIFSLKDPDAFSVEPSATLKAFAQRRAEELVEVGFTKKQVRFFE